MRVLVTGRGLVAEGQMMLYAHDRFRQCIDTFRDYKLPSGLWESGTAPWRKW